MREFGLIGKTLSHSFSQKYFTEKFEKENINNCSYNLFELSTIKDLPQLLSKKNLTGFNITIPYKEEIIPYLQELSPEAKAIEAVNCVKVENNRLVGYNTDCYGFTNSLTPLLKKHHRKALILGTGGASKAVKHALHQLNIEALFVSRSKSKKSITYSELSSEIISEFKIIINCTPLGTYPNIQNAPNIDYSILTSEHLLYDLVYNPAITQFLNYGNNCNAITKNGYEMLILQAEKGWELWNS